MSKIKNNIKEGFTLAEVLLTLVIVGIVAALVIPSIIQTTQNAQYKTAWKDSFSMLSQAHKRLLIDIGGSTKGLCTEGDDNCLRNAYLPYLSYVKLCNNDKLYGNCWHNNSNFWFFNGAVATWGNMSGIILNNGMLMTFWYNSDAGAPGLASQCTLQDPDGPALSCGQIYIDVNGFRKPNVLGRDIFTVHIMETDIKPYGISGDLPISTNCVDGSTAAGNYGHSCSARYLMQ